VFDAELLRQRAMMVRQGRRAAFAVIALIFALIDLRRLLPSSFSPASCPTVTSIGASAIPLMAARCRHMVELLLEGLLELSVRPEGSRVIRIGYGRGLSGSNRV
jgi:hypothetical protein